MTITAAQEQESLSPILSTSSPTEQTGKVGKKAEKGNGGGQALAGLIYELEQLVNAFTGTMQVFQSRFGQLSDREAQLAAVLKKININGTSKTDNEKFQKEIMSYKQQLNAVQNQQQLASVAMQGASSNESTMLTMLGNVVKVYGSTLVAVAQAMSG